MLTSIDMLALPLSTWPHRLLTLRAPWWWMVLYHSKRRENRSWTFVPAFRGPIWIHASQEFDDDFDKVLADILRAIPLPRGAQPPPREVFEANAGRVVGRVRLHAVERNTARVCLADPWAQEGALGLLLDEREGLDVSVPWKGGQGLVTVPPVDFAVVTIIAEQGGAFDPERSSVARARIDELLRVDVRQHLPTVLARLEADRQLRRENGVFYTRDYSSILSKHRAAAAAEKRQIGFGW